MRARTFSTVEKKRLSYDFLRAAHTKNKTRFKEACDLSTVFLRLIFIYILTTLSLRLMGKRQIGQMQMSELVTALFLSELAAYPITNQNIPLTYGIIPSVSLICIEVILSFLSTKSPLFKRLLDSAPSPLVEKGRLRLDEIARARLTAEELLSELRLKDVPSLKDVDYALLEPSGEISVIRKGEGGLEHLLVSDGVFNARGLSGAGLSEQDVRDYLSRRKRSLSDVFLLCKTDAGIWTLIEKEKL